MFSKLLLGVGCVHYKEGDKEHALIVALQILQQLLGFNAVGGQIRGNDVHVVTGANRFLLLFDFHLVENR